MKRLLLTGAAGFVGHHTLAHLLKTTDWEVVVTDSFRHFGTSSRLRAVFEELPQHRNRVKEVTHDLSAPIDRVTASEIGQVNYIINMASNSHVDRSISDPRPFVENNVALQLTMLEFARTLTDLEVFLHISTDEVYGPAPIGQDHDEWSEIVPSNPYSASKAAQEALAISYWRTYGINISIVNSTNIIGEAQNIEKFLPKVISRILSSGIINIDTDLDGNMGSRKYVYARDMVSAIWLIINNATNEKTNTGRDLPARFHISGSAEISNQMLVNLVGQALKVEPKIQLGVSPRFGYDLRYELDSSKIRALGWEENLKIENSIEAICKWTLANQEWLSHDYSN